MRISDWSSDVCSSDLDGFWITKALCGFGNFRHRSGHGRPHLAPACLCRQCHADHGPKRAVVVHVAAEGCAPKPVREGSEDDKSPYWARIGWIGERSEEHTSELQSLMRISYAVFCLKKKKNTNYKINK